MADILHHFDKQQGSLHTVSDNNYTFNPTRQRIADFVQVLHDLMPEIEKEYNWITARKDWEDHKPFKDKSDGLARLKAADRDLYYWYVENPKR